MSCSCACRRPWRSSRRLAENGILSALRPGFILVDSTTSDPVSTCRIGTDVRAGGADMVDAPMGRTPGKPSRVRSPVSSAASAQRFDRVNPIIATFADTIIEFGPLGSAHTVKLLNNFLAIGTAAIVGEALAAATLLRVNMNILRQPAHFRRRGEQRDAAALSALDDRRRRLAYAGLGWASRSRTCACTRKMADKAGVDATTAEAASQTYRTAIQLGHARQFMPVLPSILATLADGKPRDLPKR